MKVTVIPPEVVKVADGSADRALLAKEAAFLATSPHPGLVTLIRHDADALATVYVGDTTVADLPAQPPSFTAGWAAAVASTLGDLHDLGLAHGAVSADHIIFDPAGRPVLCSLGHSGTAGDLSRSDVAALAALLLERLDRDVGRPWRRVLRLLERAKSGRVTARQLARALAACPGACITPPGSLSQRAEPDGVDTDNHGEACRPKGKRRAALAGVMASVAIVAAIVSVFLSRNRSESTFHAAPTIPTAADALYEIDTSNQSGWVSASGRWGCGPDRPAALDPSSGEVWVFSSYSPNRPVTGVLAGRLPGATGLAVTASSASCDALLALRRGRSVPVRIP